MEFIPKTTTKMEPDGEWTINPVTNRRIKVGGPTWKKLEKEGLLDGAQPADPPKSGGGKAKGKSGGNKGGKKTAAKVSTDPVYDIAFSDVVEGDLNAGNQQHGEELAAGFTIEDLHNTQATFEDQGAECEFIDLVASLPEDLRGEAESAAVLIIRQGADIMLAAAEMGVGDLLEEQEGIEYDTEYLGRGKKVVNKRANHTICFDEEPQDPDTEEGQGTVVAFDDLSALSAIREALPEFVGENGENLPACGTKFYDPNKTGIKYHGKPAKLLFGVRVGGDPMAMHFHWFHQSSPVGNTVEVVLNSGDMYMFSEKVVGNDWKKRKVPTIRHATGHTATWTGLKE